MNPNVQEIVSPVVMLVLAAMVPDFSVIMSPKSLQLTLFADVNVTIIPEFIVVVPLIVKDHDRKLTVEPIKSPVFQSDQVVP